MSRTDGSRARDELRSGFSLKLEPLVPDQFDGSDAYIATTGGLTTIVITTDKADDKQIGPVLVSASHHVREHQDAVVLFVAPEISERLVAYWMGVTAFQIPGRTSVLVPLTESQLRAVAEAGGDLAGLCRQVADETSPLAEAAMAEHGPEFAAPAAQALLVRIGELVAEMLEPQP